MRVITRVKNKMREITRMWTIRRFLSRIAGEGVGYLTRVRRGRLAPYIFGPLPVEGINSALGLELDPGEAVMSVNAQKHAQRHHPEDYGRCFPHVASIVTGPLYVRDDFRNDGKIELVGKPVGLGEFLLVAVEIELDQEGRYNIVSFYPISDAKVEKRRQSGHYRRVLLV